MRPGHMQLFHRIAKSNEPIALSLLSLNENKNSLTEHYSNQLQLQEKTNCGRKFVAALGLVLPVLPALAVTPIFVPIALALLAGAPVAVWLSANVGWVYGGLTLLSIVSLVLGFRWMGQKTPPKAPSPKLPYSPFKKLLVRRGRNGRYTMNTNFNRRINP